MSETNLDDLALAGTLSVGEAITPVSTQVLITKYVETVAFGDMTDVTTTGEVDLALELPIGAVVLRCYATAVVVFAGDTSAAVTVGDGTDVDRYMTGTPDVFSNLANGQDWGIPSGAGYHAAAKTVTVIVTTNADFTSVSAGSLAIEVLYYT